MLIFEKASWDLQQFANVREGMDIVFEDGIKSVPTLGMRSWLCMHMVYQFIRVLPFKSDKDIGVVHGDIKPPNVLVFKDAITRGITVKVADFGYSTLAVSEHEFGKNFLPKPKPWNTPEHYFGWFTAQEAKKTDVYSFCMLCLLFLFENRLSDIPQTVADGTVELISFDAPLLGRRTLLELLGAEDRVEDIAGHPVESMPA